MNNKSIKWRDFTRKCKDTRGRFRVPIFFTTIIKFVYATRCSSPESGLSHTQVALSFGKETSEKMFLLIG